MNKQKRISLSAPQSRSSRMRMLSKSVTVDVNYGSLSANVPVNITFEGQDLTDAKYNNFFKKNDNYTNANFKNTEIYGQNFEGVILDGADFTGAINASLNTNFTDAEWTDPFNPLAYSECEKYAFGCRNIDTVSGPVLKAKIAENPTRYCNEVMGRSCGDNYNYGPTFYRWKVSGGKCPPERLIKGSDYNRECTRGCEKTEEDCVFCGQICQ